MPKWRRGTSKFAAIALVGWVIAVAAPVAATVMIEVPVEDMTRDADAIVHGVVQRSGTQMQLQNGRMEPRTVTQLRVREWIKGGGSDLVTIREIGGEWQGGGMWIDGTPRYAPGEEVIVFLRRAPSSEPASRAGSQASAFYRTYGMAQGKYVVTRGVPGVPSRVTRDLSGIAFTNLGGSTVQHRPDVAVELETFLQLVRDVVAYGGGR